MDRQGVLKLFVVDWPLGSGNKHAQLLINFDGKREENAARLKQTNPVYSKSW